MGGRRHDSEVGAAELAVPITPPQATNQFLSDRRIRRHENWRDYFLVAMQSDGAQNTGQYYRIISDPPPLPSVLRFVTLVTENTMDNSADIVAVSLLFFM